VLPPLLLWRGGVASTVVAVVVVVAPAVVEAASWKRVAGKHRILFRSKDDGDGGVKGEEAVGPRDGVDGSELTRLISVAAMGRLDSP
jgi:hypothetical protein